MAALPSGCDIPVIVVGAFGTGDTALKLPFMFKLFYRLVLREQMADKEKQVGVLKASAVCYTLIQPVALTDNPATSKWTASRDGSFEKSEVSRADLAAFIVQKLQERCDERETITFAG